METNTMLPNETLNSQQFSSHGQLRDHEAECLAHMAANGCPLQGELKADGRLHRYSADAKRNQLDEWYICHRGSSGDGRAILTCVYGSWSGAHTKFTFKSYTNDAGLSKAERVQLKQEEQERQKRFEEELKKDRAERLGYARTAWNRGTEEARSHPYLERKKIGAYGLKFGCDDYGHDVLVVPIKNSNDELQAVQFIRGDGEKRIFGLKKGCYHLIGAITENSRIFVAEGYATAASIHEASREPVVVAFDCGNLDPVVGALRHKFRRHRIVIAADDDVESDQNPGRSKGEAAAKKYACDLAFPNFSDDFRLANGKRATDFNDILVHFGLDALRAQLPRKITHLIPIDIAKFLASPLPPRKHLLMPWLPEQGLAMIYATRGIGKTFFALTIGYVVAAGEKFYKWEAAEPRKVLYVDGEMPAAAMQERIAKIARAFGKEPPASSFFKLITPDLQERGIRDLSTKEGQSDVNDHLDDVDLIILDNVSTLVRSGSENEAESWVPVQEWALNLRKRGKSVLFIHHAGKAGSARGTSKREDVLDTVIALKRPKEDTPADGAKFEVHFEKARGFDGDAAAAFEASFVIGEKGTEIWVFREMEERDLDRVAELHNDGLNQREISKEIGRSLGYVNKKVNEARKMGLLK